MLLSSNVGVFCQRLLCSCLVEQTPINHGRKGNFLSTAKRASFKHTNEAPSSTALNPNEGELPGRL